MSQEIAAADHHGAPPLSRALSLRNWPVLALLLYFAARLLFFAVAVAPFVPPDEVTHFGKCVAFSKVLLLPENGPDSYEHGLVTDIAWLYYYLMGKLLPLNVFGLGDLVFLRLCNIPMALGTVFYARRMLRLLTADRLADLLVVVLMTNTLMFSFVSASVSYDNLVNLLAAASLYYLFSFFRDGSGTRLAISLFCQLAGCLAKLTFLPLFLIMTLLLAAHQVKRLPAWPGAVYCWLCSSGGKGRLLALGIVLAALLNVQLYGGNLIRYGHLEVESHEVLPLEHALKYRLSARTYIVDGYREGRLSFDKAMEMAAGINLPGDRKGTENLLKRHLYFKNDIGELQLPLVDYVALWFLLMKGSTFGIKAHLGMENRGVTSLPMALFILACVAAFLRGWRPRRDPLATGMALAASAYAAVLLFGVNYRTYLVYLDPVLGVAGRYMFPVLAPIYVLASYYLMRPFQNEKARRAVLLAGALVFVACDFPFFLANVTPQWFTAAP